MTKITDIPTGDGIWIPHRPGDPMPVDGDTVVEVIDRNGNVWGKDITRMFVWENVTAYRIHKKEREMKYKAGDRVTIILDETSAHCANIGYQVSHNTDRIISHEPAPEPIVGYVVVSNKGRVFCDENRPLGNGEIKFRYEVYPATKEVKAEIVA